MPKGNSEGRKWQLTINNPKKHGLSLEKLYESLQGFSLTYFCICKEIGNEGKTPHFHAFLYSKAPKRFSTVKNRFPSAHIEKAYGTCYENREYLLKEGKWENDHKADTKVTGTFREYGDVPSDSEEQYPELATMFTMVREKKTTTEIITEFPQFALQTKNINSLRDTYCAETSLLENRKVFTTYICADDSMDKIGLIYSKYHPADVCRITNYGSMSKMISFDGYHFQDVLVFDRFSGQISLGEMVDYLGIYPMMLPARYEDRVANYKNVYILSNTPVQELYRDEQEDNPGLWKKFLESINKIVTIDEDGTIEEEVNKCQTETEVSSDGKASEGTSTPG